MAGKQRQMLPMPPAVEANGDHAPALSLDRMESSKSDSRQDVHQRKPSLEGLNRRPSPGRRRTRRLSSMVGSETSTPWRRKFSLGRVGSQRNVVKLPKPLSVRDVVRYGDVTCLADLKEGGLLSCNSTLFDAISLDAQRNFDPSLSVHRQEECCFVILQKFQFSAAKAFDKLLTMSDVVGITASNWRSKISHDDSLYRELRNLRRMIDAEQVRALIYPAGRFVYPLDEMQKNCLRCTLLQMISAKQGRVLSSPRALLVGPLEMIAGNLC